VRLFGSPLGLVRGLRSAGLLAFDAFPPAKSAMARLSVGAAGRVPRLARGVPLATGR
jgi:2-octaprenyl-6-methoxyphenol hydroxylase